MHMHMLIHIHIHKHMSHAHAHTHAHIHAHAHAHAHTQKRMKAGLTKTMSLSSASSVKTQLPSIRATISDRFTTHRAVGASKRELVGPTTRAWINSLPLSSMALTTTSDLPPSTAATYLFVRVRVSYCPGPHASTRCSHLRTPMPHIYNIR